MRYSILYLFCALLLLALAACRPFLTETVSPADSLRVSTVGSIDAVLRGDITGFVTLCDEFGTVKPKSDSMIVSLEGLQTAFPARSRSEGRYVIANAFAGKYNLSYNKPGYGNYKQIGITHIGGSPTLVAPVTIWEKAQTAPSGLTVTVNGLKLTLSGVAVPVQPVGTAVERQRRVRLFFGRDDKVSHVNHVTTLSQTTVSPGGPGAFTTNLLADDLLAFKPGERVYAIAYGITVDENTYEDPDTKRKVYTSINPTPSNVVSFVLP